MTTQIADIYEPLTFNAAVDERATELNAFLASGVAATDPVIAAQASQGGSTGEVPYFGPLATTEPNYSTDDPSVHSTPEKIVSKMDKFRVAYQNQSWSTMDLARELALSDPLSAITAKIGQYWATQAQRRVIQSSMGLLNDSVANHGGDMVYNVATDDVGAPSDAELISHSVVVQGAQTLGDHKDLIGVIALHSVPHARLQDQNAITYESSTADASIMIPTYLGYIVVVDDGLPAVAGSNRITYTSVLYALGSIRFAAAPTATPSEPDRMPTAGNGGGQTVLHTRRNEIWHPTGYQFVSASVAGQSATQAELADATNWTRSMHRKNIGMAFIQTNG